MSDSANPLPGLADVAAVDLWDRIHDAIDREHGKLLAELGAKVSAAAIGQEIAFACAAWGKEPEPGEEPDVITGAPLPSTARWCAEHQMIEYGPHGKRIEEPPRIAAGTLHPLQLPSGLRLRATLEGDHAMVERSPGICLGVAQDEADAVGDWFKAFARLGR